MEVDNLSYSNSKKLKCHSRLHSDFKARHKQSQLDEYRQSLSNSLHPYRHSSFDKSSISQSTKPPRSPTPVQASDLQLTHYTSLTSFKQKLTTPISNSKASEHQKSPSNLLLKRQNSNSELWNTLNLNTLYRGREIIKRSGLAGVSWTYKRQLRQFCLEALKTLEN